MNVTAQESIAGVETPRLSVGIEEGFANSAPEIVIRVTLPGSGVIDVIAYMRDTTLYLPVVELFSFLHIPLESTGDPASISGYHSMARIPFTIDTRSHLVVLGDTRLALAEQDFILGITDCFLSTGMLSRAFGINAAFNEDQLLVTLHSERPFPVQLEREREQRRQELQRGRRDMGAFDLELPRQRHLLAGGILDWDAGYSHTSDGSARQSLSLQLGSELLGGDLSASFAAQSGGSVRWSDLPWKWRYVDLESPAFRQANVGWVSTLLGQQYNIRGVSLSNEWVYSRTEYGTDDITGETEPGTDVELYRSGKLFDITVADSSGAYRFTVPLRYGTNQYEIREYARPGVINKRSIRRDVPGGFLPSGEMQYRVSGGAFQPINNAYVGESVVRYGLGRTVNVGGGLQYFVGIPDEGAFPAVFLDARLFHGFFVSAIHHQGIMSSARMSLFTTEDLRAEFNYLSYAGHPFFSYSNARTEMRGGVALPLSRSSFRTSVSFNGRYLQYERGSTLNANATLAAGVGTVHMQLTTYLGLRGMTDIYETQFAQGILQVGTPILRLFYLQGNAAFDYQRKSVTSARVQLSYQLTRTLSLNAQWIRSISQNLTQLQFDLRVQLPFARLHGSASHFNKAWQFVQRASGGIAWDQGADALLFSDRAWVGRSAVSVLPFMDANGNAELDEGEDMLGIPVTTHLNRSRRLAADVDDVTRFVDMEQYATYNLHIDAGSLADPLLVPRYRDITLVADPNQFKAVYLPVFAGGEIAGEIRKVRGRDTLSEGGIRLLFRNASARQAEAFAYSFSDGSYSHFGLAPGTWIVTPDSAQLRRRGLESHPREQRVTLRGTEAGDFISGVDFLVRPLGGAIAPPEALVDTLPAIAVIESEKPIAPPLPIDSSGILPPPIVRADTILPPPGATADTIAVPVVAFTPVPLGVTEHLEIDLLRSGLDSGITAYLDRLVETTKTTDRYSITLEGHSDNFGSFSENQQRSQERAERVLSYLQKKGIPRNRIQSQAFGSRQPRATNTTSDGRKRNNRADITLHGRIATPPPAPVQPQVPQPRPTPRSSPTFDSTLFRPPSVPEDRPENVRGAFTLLIETGQPGLSAQNTTVLDQVVRQVGGLRVYIVQVEGHSDNFGSFTQTQRQSEDRANRVVEYLIRRGIPRERLQVQAFGSRKPAASNRTTEGRRLNNRVEIRILAQ